MTNGNQRGKRIGWIDIARGILIVFVVLGHVKSSYSSTGILSDSFILNYSNVVAYSFHMAAFFFISGILFSSPRKENKSTGKRVVDKLISYGIPYVIFSVVYYVMQIAMSSFSNHTVQFKDIIFIFVKPFSFLWFIYALMIMQIFQELFGEKKPWLSFGIAAALYVVNILLKSLLSGTDYTAWIICDVLNFYIYFALGVCFGGKIVEWLQKIKRKSIVAIILGVLLLAGALCKMYFSIWYVGEIVLAAIGTVWVIVTSQAIGECKFLEKLGRESMPIYLLHGYVISFLRILLTKLKVQNLGGGGAPFGVYNYGNVDSFVGSVCGKAYSLCRLCILS